MISLLQVVDIYGEGSLRMNNLYVGLSCIPKYVFSLIRTVALAVRNHAVLGWTKHARGDVSSLVPRHLRTRLGCVWV